MAEAQRSFLARRWPLLLLSLVVGGGFAWLLSAGALPVVPDKASFAAVPKWVIAAYCALWLVVISLRAVRWYWLLRPLAPVTIRRVMGASFVGYGALILLPFRMGELVRPTLIRKKGELSGWAATGSAGAERVLDGLFISSALFVALLVAHPLDPLPDHIGKFPINAALVPRATYTAIAFFAAVFTTMGVFYFWRAWARRMTEAVIGLVSKRLANWLSDKVEHVANGLRFLPRASATIPFLLITVLYWCLNASGIWLVCNGAGLAISYSQAFVVMGVLALGILVPNAPGFFGSFQISIYAGLAMFIAPERVMVAGAAAVFILYVSQITVTLGAAAVALAVERVNVREALASDSISEDEPAKPLAE
jgi:hypothetical protein